MRDILVTMIIVGALPFCFVQPWIGILVWSWIGYMNPHRLSWGFATTMPFAQIVAIVTVTGWLCTTDRYRFPWTREVYLLLALWGLFFLSTLFAFYPQDAWRQLDKVSKILFMTFMTLCLMQDPARLRALLLVIALSLGFFGLKGGIFAVTTGGAHQVLGPEGTFIDGNTEIGLALNMVLPLLVFLRREEPHPWLRRLLLVMFGFSIIAILITYSRGALLGLAAVLSVLFFKSRIKLVALLLLAVGIPIAFLTMPDQWFRKMQTMQEYEQDGSAAGRLIAWDVAYRIALDHPLLGGGFRPFQREVYAYYLPNRTRTNTDGHSIFFQVLAEHGFSGLLLYLGLFCSTLLSLRQMIHRYRYNPSMQWVFHYAQMVEASLVGYLISGLFLSMSYFDLYYHLVAVAIILKKFSRDYEEHGLVQTLQPLPAARVDGGVVSGTAEYGSV